MQPVIVASWPSIPVEIVRATGCRLALARGAATPTPAADAHLEPRLFPSRLRHLVEDALVGRLSSAARVVIPRTSDADYKCFLYLRELVRIHVATAAPPVVLFDLLQSRAAEVTAHNAGRTRALLDDLASASGHRPSADDLRQEIARANAARGAAKRFAALRRGMPRVTGTEAFRLLAAFWETDPDRYVEMAGDAARRLATAPPLEGPRVLLAGAPVDGPALHGAIESHGAVVVAEVGPWGSGADVDVAVDHDPIAALAGAYQRGVTGARTPVSSLRRRVECALDDVDAVVVSLPPDDAVFAWDYPALRALLQARRLPHVCLRGDPHEPLPPADATALAAMVAGVSHRHETRHG